MGFKSLFFIAFLTILGLKAPAQAIVSDEPSDVSISPGQPAKGGRSSSPGRLSGGSLSSLQLKLSGVENYALNRPGIVMVPPKNSANVYANSIKMNNKTSNSSPNPL